MQEDRLRAMAHLLDEMISTFGPADDDLVRILIDVAQMLRDDEGIAPMAFAEDLVAMIDAEGLKHARGAAAALRTEVEAGRV